MYNLKLKVMMRRINKRDLKTDWVQIATLVISLVFALLVGFGVVTGEQSAEAQPIIASIIAGVVALVGIFFKGK